MLNSLVLFLQGAKEPLSSALCATPRCASTSLFHIVEESKKEKKSSILAPENIFIFDDMSTMLRDESVSCLLKKNRHFKSKVIISSQYPYDLNIPARKQIDYWMLFKGQSEQKLKQIYSDMDLEFDFDKFSALYDYATRDNYNFLYVDTRHNKYRKNFNIDLDIKEPRG